jgi:hypothetical protein
VTQRPPAGVPRNVSVKPHASHLWLHRGHAGNAGLGKNTVRERILFRLTNLFPVGTVFYFYYPLRSNLDTSADSEPYY